MPKRKSIERIRGKRHADSVVVGVSWYSEENWVKVRAYATDAERFEASFADWLAVARESLARIRKSGINAMPFEIVAEDLQAWCLANGKPNNSSSRAEFIAERLRQADKAAGRTTVK